MSSSLEVRRYNSPELNRRIEAIESKKQIGVKAAIHKGYKELECQRGKVAARALTITSVAFSTWCIFSSVLSAYSAGKAYEEFQAEGGFSDGGGSIGGHTAEWWPRIFGSIITSVSWLYFLNNKGMFHHTARLCDKEIEQIESSDEENKDILRDALIDYGVKATEEYRGRLPIFGDEEYVFLPREQSKATIDASDSKSLGSPSESVQLDVERHF